MDTTLARILASSDEGSAILARGLSLLHLVSTTSGASVRDLAAQSGIPLATTYRLVAQLREAGFVVEYDGRIHAGAAIAQARPEERQHLVELARPALARAVRLTGLTAVLTVRVHTLALCLDVLTRSRGESSLFRVGETRELHAGASATPLLAFASDTIVENVIATGLRRYTAITPTAEVLREKLTEIRSRGYDVSHGELQPGWTAVGLPLLQRGAAYCCISLVGETRHIPDPAALVDILRDAAQVLERSLPPETGAIRLWNPTDPTDTDATDNDNGDLP
jgi:DNA-binding IclR family transcriptional regulator